MTTDKKSSKKLPYDSDMIEIIKERNLNSACLHMLVYLKSKMNQKKKNFIWYEIERRIAENTGLGERTVRRALRTLASEGLIRREKRYAGNETGSNNFLQYSFMPWWDQESRTAKIDSSEHQSRPAKNIKQTGQFCRADRSILQADRPKSVAYNKEQKARTESRAESKSSPPTPPGGFEEEGPKTFFQNGSDQQNESNRFFSARRSNRATARPDDRGEAPISKVELRKLPFGTMPLRERKRILELVLSSREKTDPALKADLAGYLQEVIETRSRKFGIKPVVHVPAFKLEIIYNILTGSQEREFMEWRESNCTTADDSTDYTGKFRFEK